MSVYQEQIDRLMVMSTDQTAELIEQQRLRAEIIRIQQGIDTGRVWQNEHDGRLAAGFIASGLCRERR